MLLSGPCCSRDNHSYYNRVASLPNVTSHSIVNIHRSSHWDSYPKHGVVLEPMLFHSSSTRLHRIMNHAHSQTTPTRELIFIAQNSSALVPDKSIDPGKVWVEYISSFNSTCKFYDPISAVLVDSCGSGVSLSWNLDTGRIWAVFDYCLICS